MKISIDTKEDSHEEIKKAIRMLTSLVHERETYSNQGNIFDNPGSMSEPSRNIFESSEPTVTPAQSSEPSGGIFGNLFDSPQQPDTTTTEKETQKEEMPEMIPYD